MILNFSSIRRSTTEFTYTAGTEVAGPGAVGNVGKGVEAHFKQKVSFSGSGKVNVNDLQLARYPCWRDQQGTWGQLQQEEEEEL